MSSPGPEARNVSIQPSQSPRGAELAIAFKLIDTIAYKSVPNSKAGDMELY